MTTKPAFANEPFHITLHVASVRQTITVSGAGEYAVPNAVSATTRNAVLGPEGAIRGIRPQVRGAIIGQARHGHGGLAMVLAVLTAARRNRINIRSDQQWGKRAPSDQSEQKSGNDPPHSAGDGITTLLENPDNLS